LLAFVVGRNRLRKTGSMGRAEKLGGAEKGEYRRVDSHVREKMGLMKRLQVPQGGIKKPDEEALGKKRSASLPSGNGGRRRSLDRFGTVKRKKKKNVGLKSCPTKGQKENLPFGGEEENITVVRRLKWVNKKNGN